MTPQMTLKTSIRDAGRHRPARLRRALVALSVLLTATLTACGDPDDGGGGDGGGYLARGSVEQVLR